MSNEHNKAILKQWHEAWGTGNLAADSEAGVMPSEQLLTEMDKFNEEPVKPA